MKALLITAITPAVWGTTYVVTTEFLPPDRPLLSGMLRALPAGLLLLAVTRKLPRGAWWWKSAVLGPAQHRRLLHPAVRGGVPAAGRHGGRPRRGAAPGRGRADRAAADRAGPAAHGRRGRARRRRGGPGGADRERPAGRDRHRGRAGRDDVDGARGDADQALGPAGGLAAHLDRLAAHRGRTVPGAAGAVGRRAAGRAHGVQRGRLRLPLAGRHAARVHRLVLGSGAAAGRERLAAGVAVAAGRDRGGLGSARPVADARCRSPAWRWPSARSSGDSGRSPHRRSRFSTMWSSRPCRASRSMARPSRSVLVTYFGATRSSSDSNGPATV